METYIVYQMQIDSEERIGVKNNFVMSTIIRKIDANSKEEAIGKFIINTTSIKAQQKLDVMCIVLSELASLY